MKLSELKKLASENGISLKHLNGKMLKKSELAEKLMPKGVMVKSPKKSRKPSRKKSRKPKKASRKPKKTSRKKSRKPKKASRKPKKASRKPKKKSRKPKKKSKTRSGKRKLNAYMVFVDKHRPKVEKKLKAQGKKGRELFSAIGKELGKMYREQKKTYKMDDDDDDLKPPPRLKRSTMKPLYIGVDFLERNKQLYELRKGLISVDQRNDDKLNALFEETIEEAANEEIKDFKIELGRIAHLFLEKKKIYLQDLRRQLKDKIKEIEKELYEIGIRLPTRCQPGQY
jgi:hypothetical protein